MRPRIVSLALLLAMSMPHLPVAHAQGAREHLDVVLRGLGRQDAIQLDPMVFEVGKLQLAGISEAEATAVIAGLIRVRHLSQALVSYIADIAPVVAVATGWSIRRTADVLTGTLLGRRDDLDMLVAATAVLSENDRVMAWAYLRTKSYDKYSAVILTAIKARFEALSVAYWKPRLEARRAAIRREIADEIGQHLASGAACDVSPSDMEAAERHAFKDVTASEHDEVRRALVDGWTQRGATIDATPEHCAATRQWFAELLALPPAAEPCGPDIERAPICGPGRVERGSF